MKKTLKNNNRIKDFDLFIIKDGLVLFEDVKFSKVSSQLLGGFISAINSIIAGSEQELKKISFSSKEFHLLKKVGCLFVLLATRKENEKLIDSTLNFIAERFLERYGNILCNGWNGNINIFKDFNIRNHQSESNLAESRTRAHENLQAAFW